MKSETLVLVKKVLLDLNQSHRSRINRQVSFEYYATVFMENLGWMLENHENEWTVIGGNEPLSFYDSRKKAKGASENRYGGKETLICKIDEGSIESIFLMTRPPYLPDGVWSIC